MERIRECMRRRFPWDDHRASYRQYLERLCAAFVSSGLADSKFITELTSNSDGKFWSSLSEAFVFCRLRHLNFPRRDRIGEGPDFLVRLGSTRIWIEVVCPDPGNIPTEFLKFEPGARSHPHDQILLRYTSVIVDKAKRLIDDGNKKGAKSGYLQSGIVGPNDSYVIAINACRLRHGPFSSFEGVSQYPVAVEAVFPVGPLQVNFDSRTTEVVGSGHSVRFHVSKPSGAAVSTHIFLDPNFSRISAIWAMDLNGLSQFGNQQPTALIFNPVAEKPIPRGSLPADTEYVAIEVGDGEYVLETHETRSLGV